MSEESSGNNNIGIKSLSSKINNIENTINSLMNNPITKEIEKVAIPSILSHLNNLVEDTKTVVLQTKNKSIQKSVTTVENCINIFVQELETKFKNINFENIFEVIEEVVMWAENNKTIILQYANLSDNIISSLDGGKVKLSIVLDIVNQLISIDETILIPMVNYAVSKLYPKKTIAPQTETQISKPKKKSLFGTIKNKLT